MFQQLAKPALIKHQVERAQQEVFMDITNMTEDEVVKLAARINGRRGGLIGGKACWTDKTPEQRSARMRKVVNARWDKVRAAKAQKQNNE